MAQYNPKVQALLAPVVEGMGFELVGVEYQPSGRHSVLRVYIDVLGEGKPAGDKPAGDSGSGDTRAGITVDDCAAVSHQISGLLDVEDPIPGHYTLEVSSPGLDRPLFEAAQYAHFVGHSVKVRLVAPLPERPGRKMTAEIRGVEGDLIVLQTDGIEYRVPVSQVERARLVPEL
jgi:ribosome maturation factor RimP